LVAVTAVVCVCGAFIGSAHTAVDDGPESETPSNVVQMQESSVGSGTANALPPGKQWFASAPQVDTFPYASFIQQSAMSPALLDEIARRRMPVVYAPPVPHLISAS